MKSQFGTNAYSTDDERRRSALLFGIGFSLCTGAILYICLFGFQGELEASAKNDTRVVIDSEIKMAEVLVPIRSIAPGERLLPGSFRKEKRPQIGVSHGVYTSFDQIDGQYARLMIIPGHPLHREYVSPKKISSTLSAQIPVGFRAVTIRVDVQTSVEGFARPGSKVDVQWTHRINGEPAIVSIVENAQILSAERQTEYGSNGSSGAVPSTVTLLASFDDAKKIQLASTTGQISLTLRGDGDVSGDKGSKIVTVGGLLKDSPPASEKESNDIVKIDGKKWVLIGGKLRPFQS